MDVTTLWIRINEAINTIIRVDEDDESGELLHPFIEGTSALCNLVVMFFMRPTFVCSSLEIRIYLRS